MILKPLRIRILLDHGLYVRLGVPVFTCFDTGICDTTTETVSKGSDRQDTIHGGSASCIIISIQTVFGFVPVLLVTIWTAGNGLIIMSDTT
jgi:hypothetical protein